MIETSTTNNSLKRIIDHLNTLWDDPTTGIARNWEEGGWTPEALWASLKKIARRKAVDNSYCATDEEVYGWAVHLVVDEEPGKETKEEPKEEKTLEERNAEIDKRLEKNKRERERRAAKKAAEKAKAEEAEAAVKWKTLDPAKDYTDETWEALESKEGIKKSDCEQMSLFG